MAYIDNKVDNNIHSQNLVYSASTAVTLISTDILDINGTSCSYTPPSNCKNVVYEAIMQMYYLPDILSRINYELYEDGSPMGLYFRSYERSDRVKYNALFKLKFLLPSYNGSKTYKLRAVADSWQSEARITVGSGSERFSPIVTMYSII